MSKKNYEVAFQIGAKLNPSVNSSFGQANKQINGMSKNIGKVMKTAGKLALGVAALGVAAAGASLAMANKFAATGDHIDKMSQKIGMSRKGFQEWDFIMDQSGASVESLQTGFKTLVNQIDSAATGTGKSAEAFKELGVDVRDTNGAVKDQETLFNEAVVALQKMEKGSRKTKIANDLLGKSGSEMAPLLNSAAGSIDKMRKEANDLGHIIGDDAVDAAVLFTDTMDKMKKAGMGIFNTFASKLLPPFQKFMDMGLRNLPKFQKKIAVAFNVAGKVIRWVGGISKRVFDSFKTAISNSFPNMDSLQGKALNLGGYIRDAFEKAQPYIEWFINDGIPKGVQVLANIYNGALKFYKFISNNWNWIGPIVMGIVVALIAYRTVMGTLIAVKKGLIASQLAWNLAMSLNPIGLIVLGIGALIGIGVALWKNWDTISAKVGPIWDSIVDYIRGPANLMIGIANGVIGAYEDMINFVGSAVNKIPKVKIPKWMGGGEFGLPTIPTVTLPKISKLAQGGYVKHRPGGILANIGEGNEDEVVSPISKLKKMINPQDGISKNNDQSSKVVYSPTYHFHGDADEKTVKRAVKEGHDDFERRMEKIEAKRRRLSLKGA